MKCKGRGITVCNVEVSISEDTTNCLLAVLVKLSLTAKTLAKQFNFLFVGSNLIGKANTVLAKFKPKRVPSERTFAASTWHAHTG